MIRPRVAGINARSGKKRKFFRLKPLNNLLKATCGVALLLGLVAGCTSSRQAAALNHDVGVDDVYDPAADQVRDDGSAIEMRAPSPEFELSGASDESETREDGGANQEAVSNSAVGGGAPTAHTYRLKIGDPIAVILRGIPIPVSFEETVDPDGKIELEWIEKITAEGKTGHELEKIVHDAYVPKYYRYLRVTVIVPVARTYFVRGEVLAPGPFGYVPGMTLLQAISAARGFNDFANAKKVKILRGGKTSTHNALDMEKHPDRDIPIEPGDIIIVPRSIWG